METEIIYVNPRKLALINALVWAVINIALFLVIYYVKPELLGNFAWAALQVIIGIGLAIYFCLDLRKKIGGYWSFKDALGNIFIMFVSQALIVFFFTIIFGKFIEPAYADRMKEISAATTTQMLEKMGMSQEEIDKALAKSAEAMDKQFNPGVKEIAAGIGMVAIMYLVGALIFAAIFKKDPPVFAEVTEEE